MSTSASFVTIHHYSDILCIWAYISQIRMDELETEFSDQVDIHYHLFPVFGDVPGKIARTWAHRGGIKGYNKHVLEVAARFQHLRINPGVWVENTPLSCLPAHVYLRAVRHAEKAGDIAEGSSVRFTRAIRRAFFCDLKNIGECSTLDALLGDTELPVDSIRQLVNNGQAYALLAADMQQAKDLAIRSSPTLVFNEDRQRLAGNVGYRIIKANVSELLEQPVDAQTWC